MAHRLVCRPEQELPVTVLRLSGVLDRITAPGLRLALRRCLAAQPDAVVVDVADLRVGQPEALAVFPTVADEAAWWPAAPVVLCGPVPAGEVPVFASREHALAEIRRRAAAPRRRAWLRPVPDACRQARQLVGETCERWQVGGLVAGAAVVVTELVANVVRHARTGMELTLALHDRRFSIAVRDRSARVPRTRSPGPGDSGGRGLLLIRDLADAWGVLPGVDGKVVWAAMAA